MEGYVPIGTGYQQIGGQPMVPRQKKFPHLKGVERDIALLDQARNPRQGSKNGYGGLADLYAMNNGVDPVTNMAVAPSQFDVMQKRAELAKSGEFEALNLFDNYRNKVPGSAEALMEFRNMRQAQQQFASRPQATQAPNPYTPPTQNKPLYVPTGQPQPPANMPQIASDAAAAATGRTAAGPAAVQVPSSVGAMLASAMPKPAAPLTPRVSGGVNIDPSLWTQNNIARLNPTSRSPLAENPNDMIGRPRGLGLVYSSGGSSNIARAGGKVAGWSPTYSGDRQVAPQGSSLPQNPYQAAPAQPAPFDMQAAVARNRAALDAKVPTDNIKPMNRLERQALSSAINGPTPVAVPYGQALRGNEALTVRDTMTNPRTQLAANMTLADIAKMDNDQASLRPGSAAFSVDNIRGGLSQTPSWDQGLERTVPNNPLASSPTRTPPPVAPVVAPIQQPQVAQEPTIMQNIGRHFGQSPIGTEFSRAGTEAAEGIGSAYRGTVSGIKNLGSSLANSAMQNPNFRDSIMGRWLANRNPYMASK